MATHLQALFDEEAIDFLLNVFDHLNVRVLIRVCAVSCRRAREVLWPPYYPHPNLAHSLLSSPCPLGVIRSGACTGAAMLCTDTLVLQTQVLRLWYPWRATISNWSGFDNTVLAEQYISAARRLLPARRRPGSVYNLDLSGSSHNHELLRAVVRAHAAFTAVEQGGNTLPADEEEDELERSADAGAAGSWGEANGDGPAEVVAACDRQGGAGHERTGEGPGEGEEASLEESGREPLECMGRKWALEVAPKITRAAREILMFAGEYAAAEVVVLLLVGVDARDDLPDDRAVEGGFWQLLEVALQLPLARFRNTMTASSEHCAAALEALLVLAEVAEAKRATQHYFEKMLPCAIRVTAFAGSG